MKRNSAYFLKYTNRVGTCLEWVRCLNTDGYPRTSWKGSPNGKVHRIIYELVYKVDVTGKIIRHTCDNPKCINPEHLLIGTTTDNMLDRDKRDRHGASKVSNKEVKMIRDLYKTGNYLQKDLAFQFKINPRTISSIITRTHRKTIT